jgi:hypothetical protein
MLLRFVLTCWSISLVCAADVRRGGLDLTVHEWGTFTAVADANGRALSWSPLQHSADLPCFVHRLSATGIKLSMGTVRMETPVLYFYATRPATLSVRVAFPEGLLTEWYPRASRALPERSVSALANGRLEWDSLEVRPGATEPFPKSAGSSRYYAARDTDASPIVAGGEREKLIFYRGVGNVAVPLQPRSLDEKTLEIRNAGAMVIPAAVVFENRGGQIGYRVLRDLNGTRKADLPALGASDVSLRKDLESILVEQGLFSKEAHAMVETWRDSWFEEGARVFYIVPRGAVDSAVPLTVNPAPAETVRVFVGRVELMTLRTEWALDAALASSDVTTLNKYSRFLDVFVYELRRRGRANVLSPAARAVLEKLLAKTAQEYRSPSCVD